MNKLSWQPHITELTRKLACCAGVLNRVKDSIPQSLHKSLYYTLFESHLSYGITVWGGVTHNKLLPLFRAQKKCCRIMFGDKEAYLDKFNTCARTRPFGKQNLETSFYIKEHSKPLLNEHTILTIHNLYTYHCVNEILKILKFRTPMSLYRLFELSDRKETLLITKPPSHNFVYKAGFLWNAIRNTLKFYDFSFKFGPFKHNLKSYLLNAQKGGNKVEWMSINFVNFE